MGLEKSLISPHDTSLVGFEGSVIRPLGEIALPISIGEEPRQKSHIACFLVVDTAHPSYNVILGRLTLNVVKVVISTSCLKIKFPTPYGMGEVRGATYQRLVNKIFSQQINRNMEVYVDDILVKSKERQRHTVDLAECFTQLKKYGVKLNLQKCTFGVEGEKSPLLSKQEEGERLWIYLALSSDATSTVLARESKDTHLPVYYTSRLLQGAEIRYNHLKKLVLTLVHMARKLRPYFLAHPLTVLTDQPLRHALQQGTGSRMVKWSYELNEFDIKYQPRKAIKAQALADFIAECPQNEATDEIIWDMYVDRSATDKQAGGGVVLANPDGDELKFAIRFEGFLSNNEAEYEALLCGLKIAQKNCV
ncbi:UNVERIFIED_CONTAM: hypothetical protein Slati_1379300 [Sesamum latifolium]|uniref:Reverse transcriptase domain-containing protein n=1 Tax=Sesamum latifolium TaxID=2727402 RepID=A0AAW2X4N7_9LAMI